MAYVIVVPDNHIPLIGIWIVVIIIIAVIGLLNQHPPESLHQAFTTDNSKLQYITIGGSSTTKVSTN